MPIPINDSTTILDIFSYALTNINNFKFFETMFTYFTPDFDYDGVASDIEYSMSHSGDKTISTFLSKYCKITNYNNIEDLDQAFFNELTTVLLNVNKNKWKRLYDALVVATYNPIENYDMTEERTVTGQATMTSTQELNQIVKSKFNQTETEHIDQTTTDTIDETTTDHIDETTTDHINQTKTTGNDIYGFNSNTASPVNNVTETTATGNDGNTSHKATGNDGNTSHKTTGAGGNTSHVKTGNSGNRRILSSTGDGNTVETLTQGDGNVTTTTTELEPYQLTRHGNIGVTTNVQMLEQEITFRNKQDFLDIMFSDIDKLLCSKIYN